MLWPAGWKLHKLSETSWVVSKPDVEALNHVRAIERRGCGATSHPRPHAIGPSKNLSKYAEASPSSRPADKIATNLGINAALTARRSGCFSLRITDNLQDTARFIGAAFTRKESGSD